MRVWDIPPKQLCKDHLLGEHREVHAIWTVIIKKKKGYSKHPETKRWVGKLSALFQRHEKLVVEMKDRGYSHNSPLEKSLAKGQTVQKEYVNTIPEQIKILKNKNCECKIS